MAHEIYLVREPEKAESFSGLILPEVLPRLKETSVFLVGAVDGQVPVGAAVMELERGRSHLLSIAVAEDHRRKGVATALLRCCVRVLRLTSIQNFYTVLLPEERETAALLASFGMECSDAASAHYRFPLKAISQIKSLRGAALGVHSFKDVPQYMLRGGLSRAFPNDPTEGGGTHVDEIISQVLVEQGEVTGCLLAERQGEELSLGWLASWSQNKNAPLLLMRAALGAVDRSGLPEDTTICFTAYDSAVARLAERILGTNGEKVPLCQWTLAGSRFRLTDTAVDGWEGQKDV